MTFTKTLLGSLVLTALFTGCNPSEDSDKTTDTPNTSTQKEEINNDEPNDHGIPGHDHQNDHTNEVIVDPEPEHHNDTNHEEHIDEQTSTETQVVDSDAKLLFGNSGADDYILEAVSNPAIAVLGSSDPELIFTIGKRYEIKVNNFVSHPFQIINGTNVLLSMGDTQGSFEDDSAVDFKDLGEGHIVFTFTQELANLASEYRCEFHDTMRGAITITDTAAPLLITSNEQLLFDNNDSINYILSSSSDTSIAAINSNDPELFLREGKRYAIKVTNFTAHPFEIKDRDANTLLAMNSSDGSLQSDSDINFVDDGAGTIAFTFTKTLADVIDAYRCQFHDTMTAPISNLTAIEALTPEPEIITITSDAQLLLGNSGANDYTLTSVSDTSIATAGDADPELVFEVGKRYEVAITNFTSHPFELIDANNNILLSMSASGSLEQDNEINFINNGKGKIGFTYTQALADLVTQYRCAIHTGSMLGTVSNKANIVVPFASKGTKSFTLGNIGGSDYTIDKSTDLQNIPLNQSDPTLTFVEGFTYVITVTNFSAHPLALKGGNTELLVMGGNGSFQNDPDVAYSKIGGTITFNLTPALAAVLTSYRCRIHGSMEGAININ
jgi:hypothetical protein